MIERPSASGERRVFFAVVFVLACSLAPHFLRMEPWLIAWCLLFWTYAVVGKVRRWPMPGGRLLGILAVGGNVAVFADVGFSNLFELGLAALAVLLGLKPMEMRSHRDRMVTVYMSLFLVLGSVYYTESLLATAYVGFMVVLLLAVLADLTARRGVRSGDMRRVGGASGTAGIRSSLRMALQLIALAIPIAVVLFLVFPRLPQGLLGYEGGARGGGFGRTMEPGSLSGYALDDTLDFRVRFEGAVPPMHMQYWRARTLNVFDGRAWRAGDPQPLVTQPAGTGETVTYTVLLEPRTDRVLPVLDAVMDIESDMSAGIQTNWSVRANGDLRMRMSYTGTSTPGGIVPRVLGGRDRGVFLQLPPGNPRTRQLATQWRKLEPTERVRQALAYMAEQPFVYTLDPPSLGYADTIDAFLFETRAGFCEHFASAFAFLMRAAGVPARVVMGYQGGEYNELDDYLMVRRLNAHAWVELQLSGRGWVRADPTGAAAPERISEGALQALQEWDDALFGLSRIQGVRQVVAFTQMAWDMLSFRWQSWVLGYDFQRQLSFLARLGVDFRSMRGKVVVLVATLACIILAGAAFHIISNRKARSETSRGQVLYERFCRKMARIGLAREGHVPPETYADMVARQRPDLAQPVHAITDIYVRARYGPADGGADARLTHLESLVRGFRPQRSQRNSNRR